MSTTILKKQKINFYFLFNFIYVKIELELKVWNSLKEINISSLKS
jgi:hypothetical protein